MRRATHKRATHKHAAHSIESCDRDMSIHILREHFTIHAAPSLFGGSVYIHSNTLSGISQASPLARRAHHAAAHAARCSIHILCAHFTIHAAPSLFAVYIHSNTLSEFSQASPLARRAHHAAAHSIDSCDRDMLHIALRLATCHTYTRLATCHTYTCRTQQRHATHTQHATHT